MSVQDEYRTLMAKPIEEIREDIFFRPDNFQEAPWYLVGSAEIITRSGYDQLDISKLARHYASVMLDNPEWQTRFRD